MSKYTTELRYICEEQANRDTSGEYTDIASIIAAARPHIFSFDYPYYSAEQKEKTETNILRHFYTREISEEVYGLWKLRLEDRLNLIMPYYVDLFRSADIEFNPLNDVNYTETMDQDTTGTGSGVSSDTSSGTVHDTTNASTVTGEQTTSSDSRNASGSADRSATASSVVVDDENTISKYSDTPQGSITNLDADTYLTNATIGEKTADRNSSSSDNEQSNTTSSESGEASQNRDINSASSGDLDRTTNNQIDRIMTSSDTGTLDYSKTVVGKTGGKSYSELLTAYRNTILRIDSMICDELEDLFMLLW